MTRCAQRLVDIEDTSLLEHRIGALPIGNQFLLRLGPEVLFDAYVPMDPRATLAPSASLLVVVRNLVIERAPAYKITEWVVDRPEALLGLSPGENNTLNDDRIGRALDALFAAAGFRSARSSCAR